MKNWKSIKKLTTKKKLTLKGEKLISHVRFQHAASSETN